MYKETLSTDLAKISLEPYKICFLTLLQSILWIIGLVGDLYILMRLFWFPIWFKNPANKGNLPNSFYSLPGFLWILEFFQCENKCYFLGSVIFSPLYTYLSSFGNADKTWMTYWYPLWYSEIANVISSDCFQCLIKREFFISFRCWWGSPKGLI